MDDFFTGIIGILIGVLLTLMVGSALQSQSQGTAEKILKCDVERVWQCEK